MEATSVGTWVKVLAKPVINRFDNEMVLDPIAIASHKAPSAWIQRLISGWVAPAYQHVQHGRPYGDHRRREASSRLGPPGHCHHGPRRAQSFPEAMKAASKAKVAGADQNIKILYGCEGYYVNDIDDRIVVHGAGRLGFARNMWPLTWKPLVCPPSTMRSLKSAP